MKKKIYIPLAILIILVAAVFYAGNYMVNFALTPSDRSRDLEVMAQRWEKRVPGLRAWYQNLRQNGIMRDTVIVNDRGYALYAVYAPACDPANARGTAVLVHGYTDNHYSMMNIGRIYRDSLNFNILAFDQQGHGQSEGPAIQMGWLDRLNAAQWTEVAHNIWNDDFIVVHGVSMGAATTMMLSGDPDPQWVSAYVEDCGYTSVWNQFSKELKSKFNLPAFPVLYAGEIVCILRYGWNFHEASSLRQLAKSTKPVLFIHGGNDTYVPTADVYMNYDAKTQGFKSLWIAPGSKHAASDRDYPAEYTAVVREFISEIR